MNFLSCIWMLLGTLVILAFSREQRRQLSHELGYGENNLAGDEWTAAGNDNFDEDEQ